MLNGTNGKIGAINEEIKLISQYSWTQPLLGTLSHTYCILDIDHHFYQQQYIYLFLLQITGKR